MNRLYFTFVAALVCAVSFGCGGATGRHSAPQADTVAPPDTVATAPRADIPAGARALIEAYPGMISGYEDGRLIMADGSSVVYDDGREKSFVVRLDDTDPEDMFFTPYDTSAVKPARLSDTGRGRCEQLFRKMYGDSRAEVSRNLVSVRWFGQNIRFSGRCGAADSLRAVARELATMPSLRKYLVNASSFYWRKVRGADRLSAHSYGIAIDINTKYSDYWLWKYPRRSETADIGYVNRIPLDIVKVFERHGFIWGGRWYHFDTMHFEFRPEFHVYNRLVSD